MLDETVLHSNLPMTRTFTSLLSFPPSSPPLFSFVYILLSYAKYPLGTAKSADPSEVNTNFQNADGWLYELAYNHWPTDVAIKTIVQRDTRGNYILQGVGPYALFWDADLCMSRSLLSPVSYFHSFIHSFIHLFIYIFFSNINISFGVTAVQVRPSA